MARYETDPVYRLCLGVVRQTIADALDGGGPGELAWLFSPAAQEALRHALDLPPGQTLLATCRTVERLAGLVGTEAGERLRRSIERRDGSPPDLKQVRDTLGWLPNETDFRDTEI